MIAVQALNRLIQVRAEGPPVVSLYAVVPVDPKDQRGVRARVNSLLDELGPLTEDQNLDRAARLSIRADIERLRSVAEEEHWKPPGIGLFSSSARDLFEEVELPSEPRDRVLVDATPWVRPIAALLDKAYRACVVTLDRGHAVFWEYHVGQLVPIEELKDPVLRDADYAGGRWGGRENVTHHRVQELAKQHFRRVIDRLEHLFFPEQDPEVRYQTVVDGRSPQEAGADQRFDVLVVAEHGDEVSGFLDELPDRLRQKLAGTFTNPSVDDRGALKAEADAVLDRWERDSERQLVEHVLEVEAMGGLGVTGLHRCLWAASSKAIGTLLLQERDQAPGVVCDVCGWLGERGDTCPVTGDQLRHTPDIVDELLQSVLRDSGEVRTLEDSSLPDGRSPAAHLRFPLPPEPAT
jgi:peptide subunit release factor 1 (eRF1)